VDANTAIVTAKLSFMMTITVGGCLRVLFENEDGFWYSRFSGNSTNLYSQLCRYLQSLHMLNSSSSL
jgi:hypothetical protein